MNCAARDMPFLYCRSSSSKSAMTKLLQTPEAYVPEVSLEVYKLVGSGLYKPVDTLALITQHIYAAGCARKCENVG